MRKELVTRAAMVALTTTLAGSCAVTPESCQLNQTATGALIGAGLGAAAGGLAAGLSHQHGGSAAAVVVGAAALGAAVGAIVGQERDKACRQMALRKALDLAVARDAEQRQRLAEQQAAAQQAQQQAAAESPPATKKPTRSSTKEAVATPPAPPPPPPEYMTVAWADKMTNNSGAITPIASVSGTTSNQICMSFNDTQTIEGKTQTVVGKACRGNDGDWHPL